MHSQLILHSCIKANIIVNLTTFWQAQLLTHPISWFSTYSPLIILLYDVSKIKQNMSCLFSFFLFFFSNAFMIGWSTKLKVTGESWAHQSRIHVLDDVYYKHGMWPKSWFLLNDPLVLKHNNFTKYFI